MSADRRGLSERRYTLVTGGAGFIGTNLADRLLREGRRVMVFDNLSRAGVERNLDWLRRRHGEQLLVEVADTRDAHAVRSAVRGASQVFHFAAQVAVTTSLVDPLADFEVNARGTLNVLEAVRSRAAPVPVIFTSTNKVYGDLGDVALSRGPSRYEPESEAVRELGIGEGRPLDFHSPYGCSKGAADQYVLDWARSYGVPAAVLRMSCIYGLHQFGTEDQGWVAHFLIRAMDGAPITIYGDGRQVRDVLFADDLVEAFLRVSAQIARTAGMAFNIGGGPGNTLSLLELIDLIEELHGQRPSVRYEGWRTGDQRYYVSDPGRFGALTEWRPSVGVREGVACLYRWLTEERSASRGVAAAQPGEEATL